MSLPILPQLTGDSETDIALLYGYLRQVSLSFANAAGAAIDPSIGEGGDASLTITEAPTGITYVPSSSKAVDGTLFGAIDVNFIKPDRAVCVIIYYREVGVTNFKQSFAFSSPFRLINLKVGIQYQLQLAGQAANSNISNVLSPLVTVTIPFAIRLVIGSEIFINETEQPDEPMLIPGLRGPQGIPGLQGVPGLDAEDPIETIPLPGLQGPIGLQGSPSPQSINITDNYIEISDLEPITLLRDLPAIGRIPTVLDNLGVFAATTSAQLAGVINNETGTGSLVFGTSPTLVTPNLGAATGVSLALINNQNALSVISLLNSDGGGAAQAAFKADNGTNYITVGVLGTGFTYGAIPAGGAFIYAAAASGITLMSDNASGTVKIASGGNALDVEVGIDGNIKILQGTLLVNANGGAPLIGNATLVAGTKAVLSDAITANSGVLLTRKTTGGTIGTAITYTLQTSAPKGFTINSDNPLDTSTFTWIIFEGF